MMGLPTRVWIMTPWALNATSLFVSMNPTMLMTSRNMNSFGTHAISGTRNAETMAADSTTVFVRMCVMMRATVMEPKKPPSPPPRSATPMPELLTPRWSLISLMRGTQLLM